MCNSRLDPYSLHLDAAPPFARLPRLDTHSLFAWHHHLDAASPFVRHPGVDNTCLYDDLPSPPSVYVLHHPLGATFADARQFAVYVYAPVFSTLAARPQDLDAASPLDSASSVSWPPVLDASSPPGAASSVARPPELDAASPLAAASSVSLPPVLDSSSPPGAASSVARPPDLDTAAHRDAQHHAHDAATCIGLEAASPVDSLPL